MGEPMILPAAFFFSTAKEAFHATCAKMGVEELI